jgi:hypothetical protein
VELGEAASRFAATRPAGSCPGPHAIGAYAEGQLAGREREALEGHLARCGRCTADLAALGRELAGLEADPEVAVPAWARERARALVDAPVPARLEPAALEPAGLVARAVAALRAASYYPVAAAVSVVLIVLLQIPAASPPGLAVRGDDGATLPSIVLATPVDGGELESGTRMLTWEPVPQAGTYVVTVVDGTGAILWTGSSVEPWIHCPAAVPLVAGGSYAWWVETLLESGVTIDSPVHHFTVSR